MTYSDRLLSIWDQLEEVPMSTQSGFPVTEEEIFLEDFRDMARKEHDKDIQYNKDNPVCPWATTIRGNTVNCDCPNSLESFLGKDFKCDEKTTFCPVRGKGWPEHIESMVKNFTQALAKN
jgi:hypothetical protein